ncbi:hypothetical protein A5724_15090 [Mycobacterium sp. ACS1612]|uniref:hypothetical protein n=1 Tax=Mycobacterium sp. ACS1612 TaxID=1834117 RepID=UPI0007FC6AF5|nr:hypothetical protein [Mycobacterium sp. ACS1612]OBF35946.1 hypothetical protein A5724_15090 [Mycobacterium sp. ACS1612]
MLTTGLLVGSAGGAIASADDSAGTAAQSQGVETASPSLAPVNTSTTTPATASSTPKSPISRAIQDVLKKLHAMSTPVQKPVIVKATPTPVVPVPVAPTSQSEEVTPASAEAGAPEEKVFAAAESTPAPLVTHNATPSPAANHPTDVMGPALKALQPVPTAIAKVAGVAMTVPGVLAALPTSETPVTDVITSVQNMLISVNDAVAPLAQVPGDLYSLLVFPGINAPIMQPVNVGSGLGLTTVTGTSPVGAPEPTPPDASPILPVTPMDVMPLSGDVIAPAALDGIATAGLDADLALAGTAPMATEVTAPAGALSFLEHTIRAVLAPASLTALAAFALPGIGGLLIICAAGIRVGYRQAKAALTVRSTAIARFARQGPLGVVRSGSLVSLHTRRSRRPRTRNSEVARAVPLFERAA